MVYDPGHKSDGVLGFLKRVNWKAKILDDCLVAEGRTTMHPDGLRQNLTSPPACCWSPHVAASQCKPGEIALLDWLGVVSADRYGVWPHRAQATRSRVKVSFSLCTASKPDVPFRQCQNQLHQAEPMTLPIPMQQTMPDICLAHAAAQLCCRTDLIM